MIVPVVSYWLSATGAELRVRRHCAPVHCSSRGRSKQQHALRSIGHTRDRRNIMRRSLEHSMQRCRHPVRARIQLTARKTRGNRSTRNTQCAIRKLQRIRRNRRRLLCAVPLAVQQ